MDIWLIKLLIAIISGVIGVVVYFVKKRLDKIDHLDKELQKLQNQFAALTEKMRSLESTNLPILMEIKKEMGEVKVQISVVQSELKNLHHVTERHDDRIQEINKHSRRKGDPKPPFNE